MWIDAEFTELNMAGQHTTDYTLGGIAAEVHHVKDLLNKVNDQIAGLTERIRSMENVHTKPLQKISKIEAMLAGTIEDIEKHWEHWSHFNNRIWQVEKILEQMNTTCNRMASHVESIRHKYAELDAGKLLQHVRQIEKNSSPELLENLFSTTASLSDFFHPLMAMNAETNREMKDMKNVVGCLGEEIAEVRNIIAMAPNLISKITETHNELTNLKQLVVPTKGNSDRRRRRNLCCFPFLGQTQA